VTTVDSENTMRMTSPSSSTIRFELVNLNCKFIILFKWQREQTHHYNAERGFITWQLPPLFVFTSGRTAYPPV
jgi:hypothetical protein